MRILSIRTGQQGRRIWQRLARRIGVATRRDALARFYLARVTMSGPGSHHCPDPPASR